MANKKYVDENGLAYFWSQLKLLFNNKVDKVSGKGLSSNDYTNNEKTKLAGIAAGAEVNQNAFTKVTVGETQLVADQKQDILTLTAGSNVTLTPNANTDTVTIAATDTTYNEATTSAAGLMSADDKTKLNGIETGAQVNTVTGVKGSSESTYRTGQINITKSNIGLSNVGNFKAVSTVASQGLTDTEKANARTNIGAGTGNGTITGVSVNGTSVATSGVANITSLPASILSGAIPSAVTATTQTAGNNSTKIATTAFVKTAVDNAIGSITQIEYRVVQTLPATGEAGVIYLVPHSHGTQDIYDEYIWITSTSTFEKIGSTDIDLSDYVTDTELATALGNYLAKAGGTMTGHLTMSDKSVILKHTGTNQYGAYKVEATLHGNRTSDSPETYSNYCLALDVTYTGKDAQGHTDINAINYYIGSDGKIFKSTSNGNKYVVWDNDLADYATKTGDNTFTGLNVFDTSVAVLGDFTVYDSNGDAGVKIQENDIVLADKSLGGSYKKGSIKFDQDIGDDIDIKLYASLKDLVISVTDNTVSPVTISDYTILTTGNMIAITNAEIDTILAS